MAQAFRREIHGLERTRERGRANPLKLEEDDHGILPEQINFAMPTIISSHISHMDRVKDVKLEAIEAPPLSAPDWLSQRS